MSDLKPCPCGETPKSLRLRWGYVSGDCCGKWAVGLGTPSPETGISAAVCAAWNDAPRASTRCECQAIAGHSDDLDEDGGE